MKQVILLENRNPNKLMDSVNAKTAYGWSLVSVYQAKETYGATGMPVEKFGPQTHLAWLSKDIGSNPPEPIL